MRKLSRRQTENPEKIKNSTHTNLEEAITLLQNTATTKSSTKNTTQQRLYYPNTKITQ